MWRAVFVEGAGVGIVARNGIAQKPDAMRLAGAEAVEFAGVVGWRFVSPEVLPLTLERIEDDDALARVVKLMQEARGCEVSRAVSL